MTLNGFGVWNALWCKRSEPLEWVAWKLTKFKCHMVVVGKLNPHLTTKIQVRCFPSNVNQGHGFRELSNIACVAWDAKSKNSPWGPPIVRPSRTSVPPAESDCTLQGAAPDARAGLVGVVDTYTLQLGLRDPARLLSLFLVERGSIYLKIDQQEGALLFSHGHGGCGMPSSK